MLNIRISVVGRSDAVANEEGTNAQMSFEGDEAAQLAISDDVWIYMKSMRKVRILR
jgi:hypothetical protein